MIEILVGVAAALVAALAAVLYLVFSGISSLLFLVAAFGGAFAAVFVIVEIAYIVYALITDRGEKVEKGKYSMENTKIAEPEEE